MKSIKTALLALALVGAFAVTADAGRLVALPRMGWNKLAAGTAHGDTCTVVFGAGTVAGADTTNWLDLGRYSFEPVQNGSTTASQLVVFQIGGLVAADTMRVTFQFSSENPSSGITNVHAKAAQTVVGHTAEIVSVIDTDDVAIGRWVRAIFENIDQSGAAATKTVYMVPLLRVKD